MRSSALTRFANNHIHQNVAEEGSGLSVRAFVGKRSAIATGNDLSDAGLRDTARRALELARLAEPDEEHTPLPEPVARAIAVAPASLPSMSTSARLIFTTSGRIAWR